MYRNLLEKPLGLRYKSVYATGPGSAASARGDYSSSNSYITKDEFLRSHLSAPRGDWCDPLEYWYDTNQDLCRRVFARESMVAQEWGAFDDNGEVGAVIALSDLPCTDGLGCDAEIKVTGAFAVIINYFTK